MAHGHFSFNLPSILLPFTLNASTCRYFPHASLSLKKIILDFKTNWPIRQQCVLCIAMPLCWYVARFSGSKRTSLSGDQILIRGGERNEDRCGGRTSSGEHYRDSCGQRSYFHNCFVGAQIPAVFSAPFIPLTFSTYLLSIFS